LSTKDKKKNEAIPTFISLVPPPILAKTLKEVNKISKYLKKNSNPHQKKSYANATSSSTQQGLPVSKNIVKETLKIKEMFLNLLNNKIKQVQKVINGSNNKSKPKISMTTKDPSCKQCCGNHLLQRQMITQMVNLLVGYQVGNSQENSTRSLFLIRVLYIQSPHGLCYQ